MQFGAPNLWCRCTGSHTADISGRINSLPGREEPDQLAQGGMKTPPPQITYHFLWYSQSSAAFRSTLDTALSPLPFMLPGVCGFLGLSKINRLRLAPQSWAEYSERCSSHHPACQTPPASGSSQPDKGSGVLLCTVPSTSCYTLCYRKLSLLLVLDSESHKIELGEKAGIGDPCCTQQAGPLTHWSQCLAVGRRRSAE